MTTAFYTHSSCADHVTPPGHPERVDRIKAIWAALADARFDGLDRRDAPLVDRADVLRAHPEDYIAMIEGVDVRGGFASLDADTHMMAGSLEAARRAAGACTAAVDAVMQGDVANAFCGVRPPGHHAEAVTPMGFCLFSSAAIAVKRALDYHGLRRVALVDFDVHHGNGSQDILWAEERALFVSSHQSPLYPGSGAASETGVAGNVVNLPLPAHTGSQVFRNVWEREGLVSLDRFEPELVIISAGFDAHRADPLAQMNLGAEDFAWITEQLCDLADKFAQGRVVSTLEGGYDLEGLAECTAAHVEVLMKRGAARD